MWVLALTSQSASMIAGLGGVSTRRVAVVHRHLRRRLCTADSSAPKTRLPTAPPTAVIRIAGSNVTCRVSPQGTKLRSLLMGLALLPYNGLANAVNCRGLGTCGTCAVRLDPASSAAEGVSVSPMGARERLRLSLPPHRKEDLVTEQGSMRLACQCRVLPNANLTPSKQRGFWGQRADTCTAEDQGVIHGDVSAPQFDFELIRHLKPFPLWLQQEMRSNHAGETGAVMIYTGALWALKIRRSLGLEFGPDGYEAKVHEFSAEHQETEREHLVLLNHVLDETEALDSGGGVMPAPRNPAHSVLLRGKGPASRWARCRHSGALAGCTSRPRRWKLSSKNTTRCKSADCRSRQTAFASSSSSSKNMQVLKYVMLLPWTSFGGCWRTVARMKCTTRRRRLRAQPRARSRGLRKWTPFGSGWFRRGRTLRHS